MHVSAQLLRSSIKAVAEFFNDLCTYFYRQLPDKVRVAMFVTWLWALAGLYISKLFEMVFRLILKMPDNWFCTGFNPEGAKILFASDGRKEITNKFKLFLKYYWEKDDKGGNFSFASLQRLLNCSMLYCSYLLTEKDAGTTVHPEKFWKNVNTFFAEMQDGIVLRKDNENSGLKHVPFAQMRFEPPTFGADARSLRETNDELRDNLLALLEPRTVERLSRLQ